MWRISTHALTEGDGCIDRRRKVHEISTHALTEGDEICLRIYFSSSYFNSRPHGGRRYTLPTGRLASCISTHALTEGDMDLSYHWRIFFISTHALTEGDAQNIYDSISAGHFNSRPHGGRQRTRADDNTGGVFQLTPSRRATSLYFWIASSSGLFQLTPSRRATGTSRN